MRTKVREGLLFYDVMDLERWCFDEGHARESLHCGETLAIRIADHYLWGRLEMDRFHQWIMIFSGQNETPFTLRQGARYPARMR